MATTLFKHGLSIQSPQAQKNILRAWHIIYVAIVAPKLSLNALNASAKLGYMLECRKKKKLVQTSSSILKIYDLLMIEKL